MRRRTRNVVIGILVVVLLLLALGALPSYIKSGDPYYLTATPVSGDGPAINLTEFPEDHYPFTTGAIADADANATGTDATGADGAGYADPYWKGYVGFKEAFTHSPFDEMQSLRQRNATAVDGDAVFVRKGGARYRLALTQESPA